MYYVKLIYYKQHLRLTTGKPLTLVEILDSEINSYDEVIAILKSIKSPIARSVFIDLNEDPVGFKSGEDVYVFNPETNKLNLNLILN